MTTILLFIIILGLLVFIHELGHFLAARYFGVKAEEFGFGFPPRMVGVVYDDTLKRYRLVRGAKEVESPHTIYSLNWLPLGGFVRIKGEDGNETAPDSFVAQAAWKRVVIMVAGVAMNFFTAIVLFGLVFLMGVRQPIDASQASAYPDAQIQILQVAPDSQAQKIGLEPGDQILTINTQTVSSLEEVKSTLDKARGGEVAFVVDRLGTPKSLKGEFPAAETHAGEKFGIAYSHTAIVKLSVGEALQTAECRQTQVHSSLW